MLTREKAIRRVVTMRAQAATSPSAEESAVFEAKAAAYVAEYGIAADELDHAADADRYGTTASGAVTSVVPLSDLFASVTAGEDAHMHGISMLSEAFGVTVCVARREEARPTLIVFGGTRDAIETAKRVFGRVAVDAEAAWFGVRETVEANGFLAGYYVTLARRITEALAAEQTESGRYLPAVMVDAAEEGLAAITEAVGSIPGPKKQARPDPFSASVGVIIAETAPLNIEEQLDA